jgi:hypothetical protein
MISKSLVAVALAATTLSGCYVVTAPDGRVWHVIPGDGGVPPRGLGGLPAAAPAGPALPATLPVRLYPANAEATRTGVLTGSVMNMMNGKGRFNLTYEGETMTGAATRVDGDARRGVASAYGPSGMFMSCEYQMNSPRQGAGTCTVSNGAKYQVHIGS